MGLPSYLKLAHRGDTALTMEVRTPTFLLITE
jgi:hypothetical protein